MIFFKYGDSMNNIKRGIIVNAIFIVACIVIFKGVSYSAKTNPENSNKDLLIQTGNMQVVLNIPNEKYELLDAFNKSVSDNVGKLEDGYSFTVKNTGNIPIEYYEIRLIDQENKISTLPHKYLRYIITCDNKTDEIKNLGDNESILYSGYDLDVGETKSFNLKMWVEENELNALNKVLYGAIEITLYQKYDVYKNYILYESDDSTNVPIRSSIYNPITSTIPKKDGYKFVGWENKDKTIRYYPGDSYNENIGTTLYAIWDKV